MGAWWRRRGQLSNTFRLNPSYPDIQTSNVALVDKSAPGQIPVHLESSSPLSLVSVTTQAQVRRSQHIFRIKQCSKGQSSRSSATFRNRLEKASFVRPLNLAALIHFQKKIECPIQYLYLEFQPSPYTRTDLVIWFGPL